MSSLVNRPHRDVSNLLGEITIQAEEVLFPQGSNAYYVEPFWAMIVRPAFSKHDLTELVGTERYFLAWKNNPLVRIIKEYVWNIGKRYKQQRIELLSILYGDGYT